MDLTEDWIKLKRKITNWKTTRKNYPQTNRQKPQRERKYKFN